MTLFLNGRQGPISYKESASCSVLQQKQRLLLTRIWLTYYLRAVDGAPAYRGLQFTSSTGSADFSGKLITACTSILRFTTSTISGKCSISQRAASALASYFLASSASIFARLACCAAWSKQASSIFCSTSRGFLQVSRNSKEGRAGTFTDAPRARYYAGMRMLLPSYLRSQAWA